MDTVTILNLILLVVASAITISYFWIFIFPLVGGAPYVPSDDRIVDMMVSLAGIKEGEKAADLGSGDGRIVVSLAKAGAVADGYEISPFLVWYSRYRLKKEGLSKNAKILQKNFWKVDFSDYDVIALYQVTYVMNGLEKKLLKELKPGARVVCNAFKMPNWKPKTQKDGVFLYVK